MTDRRCGTCRHYTQSSYGYNGHCAVGAFLGRATAFSGESGCPGWSSGDDYARGWRDAVAAASAKLKDTSAGHLAAAFENQCDKHLAASNALGIAAGELAALTPPG